MGFMSNQVVVVTGAGSGLGKATALYFGNFGAQVIAVGRRKNKIEETCSLIRAAGGRAIAFQADVSIEEQVCNLYIDINRKIGRVDVLINNAAVFNANSVMETSVEEWNYQLSINLTGAFLMIREALPLMRLQHYGRIVNITSGLASNGAGGFAAYSASKAGLESLTRTVAEEEYANNIIVNMFNPGTIKSEMHATGRDPALIAPEIFNLAVLHDHSFTGRLIEAS